MVFSVNEVVKSKRGDNGVITRIDGQGIYVLWEDGSCGIVEDIEIYKTGKRMDIVYFLSILGRK